MTRDSALVQIRENKRVMKGLPLTSPQHKALEEENMKLGAKGITEDRVLDRNEAWEKVADILTALTYGVDEKYKDLEPKSIYRTLIAQETKAIFDIMENI